MNEDHHIIFVRGLWVLLEAGTNCAQEIEDVVSNDTSALVFPIMAPRPDYFNNLALPST